MQITEEVRAFAAEKGLRESEALQHGLQEKAREFVERGIELHPGTSR
jgi:phosphomethylpyrimidine synthase